MTPLRKILRFFNIIENDKRHTVLSISKIGMWVSIFMTVYVVIFKDTASSSEVLATLVTLFTMTGNYTWRRHVLSKTGEVIKDDG